MIAGVGVIWNELHLYIINSNNNQSFVKLTKLYSEPRAVMNSVPHNLCLHVNFISSFSFRKVFVYETQGKCLVGHTCYNITGFSFLLESLGGL